MDKVPPFSLKSIPFFLFFFFRLNRIKKTIDNVSAKQESETDFETEISALEKRHPKCAHAFRRIYRWRVLYGIIGFLFSVVKWIIDLIIGSQN